MNLSKIAIPEDNGQVNQHFGQSARFAVIEIKDGEVAGIEEISAAGLAHRHEGLAGLLKDRGVEAVFAGGIGARAAEALMRAGIRVYTGAAGSISSVAEAVAKGQFVSRPSSCSHGGCGGHHQHRHHPHNHNCNCH